MNFCTTMRRHCFSCVCHEWRVHLLGMQLSDLFSRDSLEIWCSSMFLCPQHVHPAMNGVECACGWCFVNTSPCECLRAGCIGAIYNEAARVAAQQDALQAGGYMSSSSDDLPGALRACVHVTSKLWIIMYSCNTHGQCHLVWPWLLCTSTFHVI
jgi:hypothetical protein